MFIEILIPILFIAAGYSLEMMNPFKVSEEEYLEHFKKNIMGM